MDQNIGKDTEKLLEQYEQQSNSVGKHAYSENLHNDYLLMAATAARGGREACFRLSK